MTGIVCVVVVLLVCTTVYEIVDRYFTHKETMKGLECLEYVEDKGEYE